MRFGPVGCFFQRELSASRACGGGRTQVVSALRASDGDGMRAVQLWGHEDVRGGGGGGLSEALVEGCPERLQPGCKGPS